MASGFGEGASPAYVSDFLATSEGLALTRAFTRIADAKMRRSIVELVEQIAVARRPRPALIFDRHRFENRRDLEYAVISAVRNCAPAQNDDRCTRMSMTC